jgi:hypothetical protein
MNNNQNEGKTGLPNETNGSTTAPKKNILLRTISQQKDSIEKPDKNFKS